MNKINNNEWKLSYSVANYNIEELKQNKITNYYCEWIKNKEKNNFDIKLKLDNYIFNKEWKIKFGEISHVLINKNNEKEQYLLSRL
jgi:hypothetical protein